EHMHSGRVRFRVVLTVDGGCIMTGLFRIGVRFQYERYADAGQWCRSYGNERWEVNECGVMRRREGSIHDVSIAESDRQCFWPAPGPRPADHPGIPMSSHPDC